MAIKYNKTFIVLSDSVSGGLCIIFFSFCVPLFLQLSNGKNTAHHRIVLSPKDILRRNENRNFKWLKKWIGTNICYSLLIILAFLDYLISNRVLNLVIESVFLERNFVIDIKYHKYRNVLKIFTVIILLVLIADDSVRGKMTLPFMIHSKIY